MTSNSLGQVLPLTVVPRVLLMPLMASSLKTSAFPLKKSKLNSGSISFASAFSAFSLTREMFSPSFESPWSVWDCSTVCTFCDSCEMLSIFTNSSPWNQMFWIFSWAELGFFSWTLLAPSTSETALKSTFCLPVNSDFDRKTNRKINYGVPTPTLCWSLRMPVAKTKSAQTIFTNIFDANNGMRGYAGYERMPTLSCKSGASWRTCASDLSKGQRDTEYDCRICPVAIYLFIIIYLYIYLLIPLVSL